MAKTKFKFTTAEGKVATRASERPYTHVVVARINVKLMREEAVSPAAIKNYASHWDYEHKMSQVKVGERMWDDRPYLMKQEDADKYAAFMAANPDRAAYIESRKQAALDFVAKRYGTADVGDEFVKQWSMSLANAQKGARLERHLASVRVAPVDPLPGAADDLGGWEPHPTDPTGEKKDGELLLAARSKRRK